MSKARIFYMGDRNIENGGYFYTLENMKWGYADVVRVTPCSDAGAADNCYWVESLTVNIREKPEELKRVLDTCGITELPKTAARKHMLIDAHIAYGAYDTNKSEVVQVGAKQSEFGEPIHANKVIRGNASLYRYAREEMANAQD
jgi:hypothetical protein